MLLALTEVPARQRSTSTRDTLDMSWPTISEVHHLLSETFSEKVSSHRHIQEAYCLTQYCGFRSESQELKNYALGSQAPSWVLPSNLAKVAREIISFTRPVTDLQNHCGIQTRKRMASHNPPANGPLQLSSYILFVSHASR